MIVEIRELIVGKPAGPAQLFPDVQDKEVGKETSMPLDFKAWTWMSRYRRLTVNFQALRDHGVAAKVTLASKGDLELGC